MGAARDGDIVTQSEGICEDVGVLVTTRDEKTAPPKKARLQKGHCTCPLDYRFEISSTLDKTSKYDPNLYA